MALDAGSVWLDARGAQSPAHSERGIPRYVGEHASALVELAPEAIGSVALDPAVPFPPSLEGLLSSGLLGWHSKTRAAGRPTPGIFHVMSPFEAPVAADDIWPSWARESGCRLVVTLYDLIPVVMRDQYLADWGHWATAWVSRLGLMRVAHQVLTISQQTADDAMEHLGIPEERLTVVDSGISGKLASLVASRAEADALVASKLPKVRDGFLLYVGGPDPRKNLEGTVEAYSRLPERLRDRHQLVIACHLPPLRRLNLRALARRLGIAPGGLVLTGFVPDRLLAALYRSCALFVFPSLYEGAGLPILEAMSCGAPVAASNTSAMPELLGDMDATFDPADPEDMARSLREVLETPGRLESLLERSRRQVRIYTWERVAKRTLEGYERALELPLERPRGGGRRAGARSRKRLAVVTPWPDQPSGAAAYSRPLVAALSEHADVDVIVSQEAAEQGVGFDRSLERVEVRNDAQFEWLQELRGYDRCLYVLDDSPQHLHVLDTMMRVPGAVLAHDVRLLGLYLDMHRLRHAFEPLWFEDKLVEMYGDRMPRSLLKQIPYDDPRAAQRVSMTQEVQAHAQLLLVHSRHQAEMLRLERPRDGAPTEVVPHGVPDAPPAADAPGNGDGPLIAAGGDGATWPKLLEAFSELAPSHPGARLLVSGEISDDARASLTAMAGRLGIGHLVELGAAEEPRSVLARASLAVHLLPDASGGTASSAVCDSLAARVPTIVTGSGWSGELPEPVALPVATDCTAADLAARMHPVLSDPALIREIRTAQDAYAERNSFARVAERYAELLSL